MLLGGVKYSLQNSIAAWVSDIAAGSFESLYFMMTPQAMRAPAAPAGSVL